MVTLRRTWHMHFGTDAEELLAGVQVGMVAGPRCRTHSHAAERARTPGLDPWRDSGRQGSGGTHPSTITQHSTSMLLRSWETFLYTLKAALRAAASGGRPRPPAPSPPPDGLAYRSFPTL